VIHVGRRLQKRRRWAVTSTRNSKNILNSVLLLGVLLAAELVSIRMSAQVRGGTLSGTITNVTGSGIVDAQVSIKNSGTGETKVVATNKDGFYTAPDLTPGTYALSVSVPGFAPEVRTGIVLTAGVDQVLDLRLGTGEAAVTAPVVSLGSSTVSGVVSSTTVREMPLNARSGSDLAALQPGVATARTQTTGEATRGFGTQMTISGARPRQNNYLLDGISVNDYTNG
jgi:hypothetical protein